MAGRALIPRLPLALLSARSPVLRFSPRFLPGLRPFAAAASSSFFRFPSGGVVGVGLGLRCFSSRPTTSSLNDPSPNWSNRPPKETILLDGCDFEHWLVVMEPPDPALTRDEIIDSYVKTLAEVVGSEEEARMKIYSVSTKHYFAFGALVSEELSYKIKTLPKVRWVLPDSYLDVKNKDYGGEPFINGQAVPYDPKYHEEWVRNNARANERSRRNDRPRNFDRSRNFERRRENMQNFQNRNVPPPPMPNQNFQSSDGQNPLPPRDMSPPPFPNSQPHNTMPPRDMPPPPQTMPNRDFNAMPNRDAPPGVPYSGGMSNMPNRDYQNQMPNPQGGSYGGFQGNPGFQPASQGYQGGGPGGGMPGGTGYQGGGPGGGMPGGTGYQGGGMPGGTGYQGGGPGGGMPGGTGYQGGGMPGGTGYQGGGPGYQGGGPGYPGGNTGFQGNNPGYHSGNPSYQGGDPVNQGGGASYQGGYQGSYQGGGFSGGAPAYQGRDGPGRDPQ